MKASKQRAIDRMRSVAGIAAYAAQHTRAFDLINQNLVGEALMYQPGQGFIPVAPRLAVVCDPTVIGRWHRPGGEPRGTF